MQKTEFENHVNQNRIQVSSKGKRLFALLIDFIFALLLANTFVNVFRQEHWDIVTQTSGIYGLLPYYGGIALVLLFKDISGKNDSKERLGGTIGSALFALMQGVQILRVHDVNEVIQSIKIFKELLKS